MNTVYDFPGRYRARPGGEASPWVLSAEAGEVFWVVAKDGSGRNIALARMILFDVWGLYIVNPFVRVDDLNQRSTYAQYLPRDLFVYVPVLVFVMPEESWMSKHEV